MKTYGWVVFCLQILLLCSVPCQADVIGSPVEYLVGETLFKGFMAYDPAVTGRRPAVLVVHEWWGQNEYARRRTTMLAKLGYVALAVDMYGEGKTALHPHDAAMFSKEVMTNKRVVEERFNAALTLVKQQPLVDPNRIAAVGYCFGGAVVLHMARIGADLKGVASFHGSLATDTPALPGEVKANILVFSGELDQMVSDEQVNSFLGEMTLAGAPFRYISYQGARHGFTNPEADRYAKKYGLPLAYDKQADQQSWLELQRFLYLIFKTN